MQRQVLGLVTSVVLASLPAAAATLPVAAIDDRSFAQHLDALIPEMLAREGMAGASVAIVRNGTLVFIRGYGLADERTKRPVTAQTAFNVGSISKTLTAWGVLRLVEAGRVDLDRPVDTYLKRWHIPLSPTFDAAKVTVRRLLSHTGGLSLSSVPEYAPDRATPDLVAALSDPANGVRLVYDPGTKVEYSGGGYMVLQLMIEDVTGTSFAAYMRDSVLVPLGMRHSTFEPSPSTVKASATPYEKIGEVPYYRYAGEAAASLSSTAEDLGRFLAANFSGARGEPAGRGVLKPSTLQLMMSPAPDAIDQYGLKWGLGYDLWPIGASHDYSAGHLGQNTGWSSVLWTAPSTRDGIVILTNDSDGSSVYTPPFCDWISWVAVPSFGPFCSGRAAASGGTLYGPDSSHGDDAGLATFVNGLLGEWFFKRGAGAAVLVAKDDRILFEGTYGLANIEAAQAVTPSTPFYIASLAKPLTAYAVLSLVSEKKLALNDTVGRLLPRLPSWARDITLADLLSQQSGIPDYYDLLDYSKLKTVDNAGVMALLRKVRSLNFAPGTRFEYSNSNYLLLGQIVERTTNEPLAAVLKERIFAPFGMRNSIVFDRGMVIPGRAIGYGKDGTRFLLDDYDVAQRPSGAAYRFEFTTTGAGGVFSSVDDLFRFARGLESQTLVSPALMRQSFGPVTKATADDALTSLVGYGFGWFVSERNGKRLVWHDGGKGGFRSVLVRLPASHLTVTVLSNLAQANVRHIASAIIDRLAQR